MRINLSKTKKRRKEVDIPLDRSNKHIRQDRERLSGMRGGLALLVEINLYRASYRPAQLKDGKKVPRGRGEALMKKEPETRLKKLEVSFRTGPVDDKLSK